MRVLKKVLTKKKNKIIIYKNRKNTSKTNNSCALKLCKIYVIIYINKYIYKHIWNNIYKEGVWL